MPKSRKCVGNTISAWPFGVVVVVVGTPHHVLKVAEMVSLYVGVK
jgi:hypothetical protein